MRKGFRKVEMFVSDHKSDLRDYINLPVVKDGKAIGVVSEAYFENWVGIKLILTLWVDIEFIVDEHGNNPKPSAIYFQ